jgi:outer membrane receptor protein involved in Fe transport
MKIFYIYFWRTSIFVLLAAVHVSFSFSQTTSLSGQVFDATTHQPITQAIVDLREIRQQTFTDENGRFHFDRLMTGRYTLSVHHVAYADFERLITCTSMGNDTIGIEMTSALIPSGDVIVRSTRTADDLKNTPFSLAIVTNDKLMNNSYVTVSDAMSREPGIALVRDGMWETMVSIRGMTRYNIVMLIDNTRIETANDHAAALSLLNPFDIDRIEIIKGGSSALAGTGAFGGVVNIMTKNPSFSDVPYIAGESTVRYESVNNSHAEYLALEGGSDMYRFRTSGMFRKADNYIAPTGTVPNSYFGDWDFSADAGLKLFGKHSFDVVYQRSQSDNAGIPGGSSLFPATAIVKYSLARRELFKAEYTIPAISESFSSFVIRVSRQNIERDVNLIASPRLTKTPHADHNTETVQIEAAMKPFEDHYVTIGAEVWQRSISSGRETYKLGNDTILEEVPLPNSSFTSAGIYAQDEWKIIPRYTTLVMGGRYDGIRVHNDATYDTLWLQYGGQRVTPSNRTVLWPENASNTKSWSVNAGIQQNVLKCLDASFLFSTAFRTPALEELYAYLTNTTPPHVGNPNLQPEKSISLDGALHVHLQNIALTVDVYYNTYQNLVGDTLGIFENAPAYVKTNIGEARIYGYELSLDGEPLNALTIRSSLSYIRGEDTKHNSNLGQIVPLQGNLAADYMIQKIGNVHADCEIVDDKTQLAKSEISLGGYALFNVGLTTTSLEAFGTNFKLSAGIQNIFDRAYVNFLSTLRGNLNNEPGRNISISVSANW